MNSEIRELHQQLMRTHQALGERLGNTTDLSEAEAILREMEEVNFRVMMAGRLLFKETTEAMDARIGPVIKAGSELDDAIADTEKVRDIIKLVGKYLNQADKVLDAVKLLL